MTRPTVWLAVVACMTMAVIGTASAAAKSAGYPPAWKIAADIRSEINKGAAGSHYKWRYSKVTCEQTAVDKLHCSGVARWRFGLGTVMNSSNWDVVTTTGGNWTAKSVWLFSGQV